MKKIIYVSVLVITSLIILSCDKANARKSSFVTHYEYTESFTTGTWHISTFRINGKQHCQDFEGRSFCFTKQNLVMSRRSIFRFRWISNGKSP